MNEQDEDMGTIAYLYAWQEARKVIDKYKIALADAIRRPMGVVPDSADGLLSHEDLDAAERRRPRITS